MLHRLDVDELSVETFDLSAATGQNQTFDPVVWTGCMSECTECGTMGIDLPY